MNETAEVKSSIFARLAVLRRALRCCNERGKAFASTHRIILITLTYRPGEAWDALDVQDYMRKMRQLFGRHQAVMRYFWVLEMQQRGAPHYHIALWVPRGLFVPAPDEYHAAGRRVYAPMWSKGSSNVTSIRHPAAYLGKYLSKIKSKLGEAVKYPERARIYGVGGWPDKPSISVWSRAPAWARSQAAPTDRMRKRQYPPFRWDQYKIPATLDGVPSWYTAVPVFRPFSVFPDRWEDRYRVRPVIQTAVRAHSRLSGIYYVVRDGVVVDLAVKAAYNRYRDGPAGLFRFLGLSRRGFKNG
jgi:hypothetical protein